MLRPEGSGLLYFIVKAGVSGLLIAAISTVARRYPGFGALIASLPLVSVLGMIWLWEEAPESARMQAHVLATFWYVLPSLPMFVLIPLLMRAGVGFYPALAVGCGLTVALYAAAVWIGRMVGVSP